jgi:hypothetical protein
VTGGGPQRRPTVVLGGGGTLEFLRRRKAAGYVQLDVRMLVVSSACSGRTPSRRIVAAAGELAGSVSRRAAALRLLRGRAAAR